MINVVTILGRYEAAAAFPQALFMATILMTVVLMRSNWEYLASYLSYSAAALLPLYVFFFVRVSGLIINPAGTAGWLFCMIVDRVCVYFAATCQIMQDRLLCDNLSIRQSGKRGDILPFIGELT